MQDRTAIDHVYPRQLALNADCVNCRAKMLAALCWRCSVARGHRDPLDYSSVDDCSPAADQMAATLLSGHVAHWQQYRCYCQMPINPAQAPPSPWPRANPRSGRTQKESGVADAKPGDRPGSDPCVRWPHRIRRVLKAPSERGLGVRRLYGGRSDGLCQQLSHMRAHRCAATAPQARSTSCTVELIRSMRSPGAAITKH